MLTAQEESQRTIKELNQVVGSLKEEARRLQNELKSAVDERVRLLWNDGLRKRNDRDFKLSGRS
jgi:regulator of replication initiation timing